MRLLDSVDMYWLEEICIDAGRVGTMRLLAQ